MDALASSFTRLLFPKARKQQVNSGITQKHRAELLAFGFLDRKRLCRRVLDVCLKQILSFPKKGNRDAWGRACSLFPCWFRVKNSLEKKWQIEIREVITCFSLERFDQKTYTTKSRHELSASYHFYSPTILLNFPLRRSMVKNVMILFSLLFYTAEVSESQICD